MQHYNCSVGGIKMCQVNVTLIFLETIKYYAFVQYTFYLISYLLWNCLCSVMCCPHAGGVSSKKSWVQNLGFLLAL